MTKSSPKVSPNLVTISSPQFSPIQAIHRNFHQDGWQSCRKSDRKCLRAPTSFKRMQRETSSSTIPIPCSCPPSHQYDKPAFLFRCASISCFQVVSQWVGHTFFRSSVNTVSAVSTVSTVSTVLQVLQVILAHHRIDFRAFLTFWVVVYAVCPSRPDKLGHGRISGYLGKIARITPGFFFIYF